MTSSTPQSLVWRRLHWRRPIEPAAVTNLLRLWTADPRRPRIVLEVRADRHGLRFLLGVPRDRASSIITPLTETIPGTQATAGDVRRPAIEAATAIRLTSRTRAVRTADPETVVRALLAAMARVRADEHLVLQLILGQRLVSRPVPMTPPQKSAELGDVFKAAWERDGEALAARRVKQGEPGFACMLRLGVHAIDPARRRSLIANLIAALRTVEAPDIRLRAVPDSARRLNQARSPWRWPLRLNIDELTVLLGWPLGDGELAGIPSIHLIQLPPTRRSTTPPARIIGRASAPGYDQAVGLSVPASLQHTWVLGPTGTGKSTLLLNLLVQDIQAGRGVVLVEPKSDLVAAVLARIPSHRQDDVVVLDPLDEAPVGLNPLIGAGTTQSRVEGLLSVFRSLFGTAWGPRTHDIMSAALLTLARRGDASLAMVPLLLTNTGFRRSVTQSVVRADPLALGAFWQWYEALSEAERGTVIASPMNKARNFLTNPRLRAVIGQRQPRFDVSQVLSGNKILLVPLRKGTLGAETAQLLGSLVVAELWQAILRRSPADRRPVTVAIDEVQDYLHLPTDLGDALARARSSAAAFVVANQFTDQLPPELRAGFLGNIRSRICFQLAARDARLMADGHPELTSQDFTSLGAFEAYASLVSQQRVSPYVSVRTLPAPPVCADPVEIRHRSRQRYGQLLSAIERDLAQLAMSGSEDSAATSGRRRRSS